MNGYFNNLAIKTVGHGNLVQPRMASMFEPHGVVEPRVETIARPPGQLVTNQVAPPALSSPATIVETESPRNVAESESPVTVIDTESHVNILDTESPVTIAEGGLFESTSGVTEPALHSSDAPPRRSGVARPNSPVTLPSRPGRMTEIVMPERVTSGEPSETPPTPPLPTTATPAVFSADEPVTNIRPLAETLAPVAQARRNVAASARNPEPEKSIRAPQDEQPSSVSIKSVVHEATTTSTHRFSERLIKQTRTRREQLLLESSPDPEPSINVTIGRVEVRATPTPSPRQKPSRAASPVMPLEEYLRKQRRGDER